MPQWCLSPLNEVYHIAELAHEVSDLSCLRITGSDAGSGTLQLGDGIQFVLVVQSSALPQDVALAIRLIASGPSLVSRVAEPSIDELDADTYMLTVIFHDVPSYRHLFLCVVRLSMKVARGPLPTSMLTCSWPLSW